MALPAAKRHVRVMRMGVPATIQSEAPSAVAEPSPKP